MATKPTVGLVLGSAVAPEHVRTAAAAAEAGGFGELWLAEDYFFTGGVSGATLALDATERITVGTGIVSAVARHPALLAMEISTMSRVYPGRFVAGIGLGVPAWIRQMGLHPASSLAALRECVTSVKALLAGEELTVDGPTFSFDAVRLTYPQERPTPVRMGVSGPNMLRLSGEVADGSILSVGSSHRYVGWARERIEEGREAGGRTGAHPVTAFAIYSVDEDGGAAREAVRGPLGFYASNGPNALSDVYGSSDELVELVGRHGPEGLAEHMPAQWIEDLTVTGTPEECAAKISALGEAGADSVALFPMPPERIDSQVALTVERVLPLL